MTYYLVFCITTVIITMWRCQLPVVSEIRPELLKSITFWISLITLDFILAPILFLITIILPESYMMNIAEVLYRSKK